MRIRLSITLGSCPAAQAVVSAVRSTTQARRRSSPLHVAPKARNSRRITLWSGGKLRSSDSSSISIRHRLFGIFVGHVNPNVEINASILLFLGLSPLRENQTPCGTGGGCTDGC